MTQDNSATAVEQISRYLLEGDRIAARHSALTLLPFEPIPKKRPSKKVQSAQQDTVTGVGLLTESRGATRTVSERVRLAVWLRDGFCCRYSDARLVFPPALELLSLLLPEELPYDNPPHGKYALTHIIMWQLWPAVDHVIPISKSQDTVSANALENLVTTSASRNSEKSASDPSVLGWSLLISSPKAEWDGLVTWYVQYLTRDESWFEHPTSGKRLRRWYRRLVSAIA